MYQSANDPNRVAWITVPAQSDFPIQNIPFGVCKTADDVVSCATRIGDTVIDLGALEQLGYFADLDLPEGTFLQDHLNAFIDLGKPTWRAVRNRIADLFDQSNTTLQQQTKHHDQVLHPVQNVELLLPIQIGDYTDFYSSKEHATNVGMMFRDPNNALLPNWLHIPVGYHGRSSSVVPSGTPIRRPLGQTVPPDSNIPSFGPSKRVDFELETAFITTAANELGDTIPVQQAEDFIFGMVLLNDWSARDMQKWEYVPLGPFLAKNFGTSISPWIVTIDALEPFRCAQPAQDPQPLEYLQQTGDHAFDIHLQVALAPENQAETTICESNFKYLYWTMSQQLAHHASNGCPIATGDLLGSGTISGPTPTSFGSLLELTWGGKNPIQVADGQRTFIQDNDTIIMRGYCQNENVRIGFGEVRNQLLPALPLKK